MNYTYSIEVRAAEDYRLLGHVSTPVPPNKLPDYWTFALRRPFAAFTEISTFDNVSLPVAEFAHGDLRWRAFKVPAEQWDQIKDMVRA